jgi:hypothetical protein
VPARPVSADTRRPSGLGRNGKCPTFETGSPKMHRPHYLMHISSTRQVWRVEDPSTGAEGQIDLPPRLRYLVLGREDEQEMMKACSVLYVCMCTHSPEKGQGAEAGGLAGDPA